MGKNQFFVTASCDIGPKIREGDHLLIDPDRAPTPGKHVMVGDRIELWDGQTQLRGVVVGRFVEEVGHV